MSDNNGFNYNENKIIDNEEHINHNNEFMLPPSNWVYLTPPMQKIKKPKLKGCSIQTAVMYRKNLTEKEMFELKPNIMVDISKFANLNEIPYDARFMRKILFDQNNEMQECDTLLEPSRHTKFASRYNMGLLTHDSAKKLKRNLFDYGTQ